MKYIIGRNPPRPQEEQYYEKIDNANLKKQTRKDYLVHCIMYHIQTDLDDSKWTVFKIGDD